MPQGAMGLIKICGVQKIVLECIVSAHYVVEMLHE